ncbi:MAG: phosphocholine cytidylyltransferase family protein [Deltaproteobacteria bacterium]|jgi:choline kinase|nr:phosphocholine cytidylyltransferase family protein [Deltaproteobacteria bacterium]
MHAVILAAGVGTRLGRPFPKSLSVLPGGERILGRQIRLLREAGIARVTIVVGFKKSLIMEEFPDVYYCYNPIFYVTNTSKSLVWALRHMDDDVLWLNGDVVFEAGVLDEMLRAPAENLVCVDKKRCGEEEVKYAQDSAGYISAISKSVAQPLGEALGINLVRKNSLPAFIRALDACEDTAYFERGIELMIEAGERVLPLDISAWRCVEVDFAADWELAQKMFAGE